MKSAASKRIDAAYARLSTDIREIVLMIRALIRKTAPELKESWKWGPCFEKNEIVLGLWGFKNHVSFVFYRGAEMSDRHKLFNDGLQNARNRMIKFVPTEKVNTKKLADYIKEAVKIDSVSKPQVPIRNAEIPKELASWLSKNKKAKVFYDKLAFTFKKEIAIALKDAKQEETRRRRLKKITEALKAGIKEFR